MANVDSIKKPLLRVENLKQYFPIKGSFGSKEKLYVRANDDVTLNIYQGETLGLVGESGCGKSTLGRSLLQLYTQTDGRTIYYGRNIGEIAPEYVLKTLNNLPGLRKDWREAQAKEAELKTRYEGLPEGDEKYQALEKLREAEKRTRDLMITMSQQIGGFMLADNLEPIAKILTEAYKENVEAYKLRKKINTAQVKLEGMRSKHMAKGARQEDVIQKLRPMEEKIASQQKALKDIEAKLAGIEARVEEMMNPYRDHPDFERFEVYRDGGVDLAKLNEPEMRSLRKDLQLIFQDPYSSLNPRLTVGQIISEGLYAHKMFDPKDDKAQDYVLEVIEKCGLAKYFVHRYPHQFSGGQRQRIGIARSVALQPKFIVCDEAVSALDVSIQSQIINLLLDLKEQDDLTYLFISHDLSVIKYISDRVAVMYLGNMVEMAPTPDLYAHPRHPYTEALLSAIPTTDTDTKKEAYILEGDIPSPIKPPSGCKFHTRCRYATDICKKVVPILEEVAPEHFVACHHKLEA